MQRNMMMKINYSFLCRPLLWPTTSRVFRVMKKSEKKATAKRGQTIQSIMLLGSTTIFLVTAVVIDCRRAHIINENLLRESDKLCAGRGLVLVV
jgi:hypothetical protein